MNKLKPVWWKVFWATLVLTVAVYLAMVLWTLPTLSAMAGGLAAFDLRPFGYGFDEARELIVALGADGRAYYVDVQQWLDTAYPALLAISTVMALIGLDRGGWGWVLAVFSISGTFFDYQENAYVHRMLEAGPIGLTPELVEQASGWTILKSISHTIAFTGLFVLFLIWLYQRITSQRMLKATAAENEGQSSGSNT